MTAVCTQWRAGEQCGSADAVRLHIHGPSCVTCSPPRTVPPVALCEGCGTLLDPAAAAGPDGRPGAHTRHPGCEPAGGPLRLIKGGRR